jgi:hypothetical protein
MDKKELFEVLKKTLKISKINAQISRQVNKFIIELGLNYKDIAQALTFYFEVEGNKFDEKYGIGIVPHVVDQAKKYYEREAKQKRQQLESVIEASKQPDIILKVDKIKTKKKRPKINLDDLEVE